MKNWEKYEEELKKFGFEGFAISNGNVRKCKSTICADCSFNDGACGDEKIRWLYEEANKPKLTKKARKFLELVETGYIARDKGNVICWFKNKPYRYDTYWGVAAGDNNCFLDLKTINTEKEFDFITWDSEPWNVGDLLKLEVK